MEQEKQQETPQIPNPNTTGVPAQDFSGIWNLKLNDMKVETEQPRDTVMSQVNAVEATVVKEADVKIEDLEIEKQTTVVPVEKVALGESGVIGREQIKYHSHYWRLFLISFFIILVTGIWSIILRLYSRYIYFASQAVPDANYQTYVDTYKKWQIFVDKVLHLSSYQDYSSLSIAGSGEDANIPRILQDKHLSYVQKKDLLQQALNSFSNIFISNSQRLASLKEDISKYGFFSQEIYNLFENQPSSTSIKTYLISLEIIKFSSAIKVFSYLDTFVSSLANILNIPIDQAQNSMQTFVDRWEKDILVYLNNCYLNPYEIDYDCNLVGDFDRYYVLINKEATSPDTNFFKKMMYYVDSKLEQTDLPSFSITFKKYDPTQKQISFTVEVNTFKQDELALIKRGIISPHIFILSNLLNLIKQSIFVVSENIDAKSIKITPKTIKIGSSVFNVNNSTMDFVLPIQKWSEREISDYIDPIFTSSP